MQKLFQLYILLLFISNPLFSQGLGIYNHENVNDLIAGASIMADYNVLDLGKGHPMLFTNWVDADLVSINNIKVSDVKFQYNLLDNNLLVRLAENERPIILDNNFFLKIIVKEQGLTYYLMRLHPEKRNKFVKVLFLDQGIALIEDKHVTPFKSNIQYHNYHGKDKKYKVKVTHFLINEDGLDKVKLKKSKDILKKFPMDTRKKINEILVKNDFELKNAEDYIRLFTLYKEDFN